MAQTTATEAGNTRARLATTPLMDIVDGTKNYWPVKLVPPPGASAGLKAFTALAEAAIQTAVDLLGRGMPTPPPSVDDLLKPVVYQALGKGEASKEYEQAITKVEARQTKLLMMDSQVVKTSVKVAAEQDQTLRAIKTLVSDLNAKMKAAGTGKLKPAQEAPLLEAIATAVQRVYDKVAAVAALNEDLAGDGGKNTGGGTNGGSAPAGGSGGGDGGGGGLGSLLQTLGMLPMMALPLLSQIPQMLQKADEDKQKNGEHDQNGRRGQNAGAPGDPHRPNGDTPPATAGAPPAQNASHEPTPNASPGEPVVNASHTEPTADGPADAGPAVNASYNADPAVQGMPSVRPAVDVSHRIKPPRSTDPAADAAPGADFTADPSLAVET